MYLELCESTRYGSCWPARSLGGDFAGRKGSRKCRRDSRSDKNARLWNSSTIGGSHLARRPRNFICTMIEGCVRVCRHSRPALYLITARLLSPAAALRLSKQTARCRGNRNNKGTFVPRVAPRFLNSTGDPTFGSSSPGSRRAPRAPHKVNLETCKRGTSFLCKFIQGEESGTKE